MRLHRAVLSTFPLLFLLLIPSGSAEGKECKDLFSSYCKGNTENKQAIWLKKVLDENRDEDDAIKKESDAAMKKLGVAADKRPENQTLNLGNGELTTEEVQQKLKELCKDYECLKKFYEPIYTFFTKYARSYEENKDEPGQRAVRSLEYMDRFKGKEDAEGFESRIRMVAVSFNRIRSYGQLKPSMFYEALLERSYIRTYRLKMEAENKTAVSMADIKRLVEVIPLKIGEELELTAAGKEQPILLGLSYVEVLKEQWKKIKAPEDDNIEQALKDYREAYNKGKETWSIFGDSSSKILAHASALNEINIKYPGDSLDLVSLEADFDATRFLRPLTKEDRIILPEAFLVDTVYRTNDATMGILAFKLAQVLLEKAFETGTNIVQHMQDEVKNCTTTKFSETYKKIYGEDLKKAENFHEDIYFMEAVQAALRTVATGETDKTYDAIKVQRFYSLLAKEYCHDPVKGKYLVNGAAAFFKPFSDAFQCKPNDNLHFVENNCFPLGSSNLHRRSSNEL